jgi:hypothetical protein
MPLPGRRFPDTIELEHDYLAYYTDATEPLYRDGRAQPPQRRLASYPPARFTISGDPAELCTEGLMFHSFSSIDGMDGDFAIGAISANELLSPLMRLLPDVITRGVQLADLGPDAPAAQGLAIEEHDLEPEPVAVPLSISSRSRS